MISKVKNRMRKIIRLTFFLLYVAYQYTYLIVGQTIPAKEDENECEFALINGETCSNTDQELYHDDEMDAEDISASGDSSEAEDEVIDIPEYIQDKLEECSDLAFEEGLCNDDPHFMLKNCPRSCLQQDDLLEFTNFEGNQIDDDEICMDHNEEDCPDWADEGFCYSDDKFMLESCKKSCHICFSPHESVRVRIGERQFIDNFDVWEDALENMIQTVDYMTNVVMQQPIYEAVRRLCINKDAMCSQWAAEGECDNDEFNEFMQINCAPACKTCERTDRRVRCPVPEGLEKPSLNPGDLNRMFERIVKQDTYEAHILSQPSDNQTDGPWVITLDNFLTSEECDRLIVLGYDERYERSTEVSSNNDGTFEKKHVSEARTSTTAWCERPNCYQDPIVQNVVEKISSLLEIPDAYGEHLQLLKYEEGQFYKRHHDYIVFDKFANHGPRILTFFLYLNSPKEGGGTRFNDLKIDVQPKRGMAVLWPSVLNNDPIEKDGRTEHEALPVTKGIKYGANAWYHLRNVKDMPECD